MNILEIYDHVTAKTPDFRRLTLEADGVKLEIDRTASAAPAEQSLSAPLLSGPAVPAPAPAPAGHIVKAPVVGTFYTAPSPDAATFVSVGQTVKKGQVLCIIEAMKTMNEIESDVSGRVTGILAVNGKLVEYGQSLFEIEEG